MKRSWFRFGLRTFLILFTLIAVSAAWVVGKHEQYRAEQTLIDELFESAGLGKLSANQAPNVTKHYTAGFT